MAILNKKTKKEYFKRPCKKCSKIFTPTGKYQKLCPDCNNSSSKERLKFQYFKSKEELDIIRHNTTLAKWKILSSAYKLGKKIWGARFTKQRLAFDMDVPQTTVLRCLALNRANKKSLRLLKANKISAFKLAMICQLKSITYHDEIVDLVIKDNLSTYKIKSLKINKLSDINKERHRLAVEIGYSRQSSAAENFQRWINRGKLFLILKEKALSKTKYIEIKKELKDLNKRINLYLR